LKSLDFGDAEQGVELDGEVKEEEPENEESPTDAVDELALAESNETTVDEPTEASEDIAQESSMAGDNEEGKETENEVQVEEPNPEEGEAIAATNGCYVVQRLRQQHHLSLPAGSELKLQIPFVKNGSHLEHSDKRERTVCRRRAFGQLVHVVFLPPSQRDATNIGPYLSRGWVR